MNTALICNLACFGFLTFSCAVEGAQPRCFQLQSLQGRETVTFTSQGTQVIGVFTVDRDDAEPKSYPFTGTRLGTRLKVRFKSDRKPDLAPSEMKDLDWRIVKNGGREILRIKLYGKNYETNKYGDYFADFESCD